jgi:hypothetical protein
MTLSSISHKCNISTVRTVITPTPHVIFSAVDEHGLILDLARLEGETNALYKRRLLETVSRRANSTYRGMVNGITRELGFELFDAMWINPKIDSSGNFITPDPYLKFDGVNLLLYSDYQNGTLEATIDRYEPGGHFEHYTTLADRINLSASFEAGVYTGVDQYTRSMTILNQSNRGEESFEEVPASDKFKLEHEFIAPGTIFFSDRNIYNTEVATSALVTSKGKFHIDYRKGIVTSYSIPSPGTSVRYHYTIYPFLAIASPVILHDVTSDNFKVKMFEQVLQDDGTYAHGIPTREGVDIINELITVFPLYYGV